MAQHLLYFAAGERAFPHHGSIFDKMQTRSIRDKEIKPFVSRKRRGGLELVEYVQPSGPRIAQHSLLVEVDKLALCRQHVHDALGGHKPVSSVFDDRAGIQKLAIAQVAQAIWMQNLHFAVKFGVGPIETERLPVG